MEKDYSQQHAVYLQQQNLIYNNNVIMNFMNEKKRKRSEVFHTTLINQSQKIRQLQTQHSSSVMVENSHLGQINNYRIQNEIQNQNDLCSLINHQETEIEQYITTQGEKLRQALLDGTNMNYLGLVQAAEQTAALKVSEKNMELDDARKTSMELENQISKEETELVMWQAKALSYEAKAAFLRGQIEEVKSSRVEACRAGSDAESTYVDTNRVEIERRRVCWVCGIAEVSVVMLPCRHLCMCSQCDALSVLALEVVTCPVCQVDRTGSVQVLFS